MHDEQLQRTKNKCNYIESNQFINQYHGKPDQELLIYENLTHHQRILEQILMKNEHYDDQLNQEFLS